MKNVLKQAKDWVEAFRLRTLPLSFSLVITGTAVANQQGHLSAPILIMTLVTTLFLQVLSNLSNDYGDSENGADNCNRVGPARAVQSGAITMRQMKTAVIIFAILSFASGCALLGLAYSEIGLAPVMTLLAVGIMCILAAITYTAGKHPYGYIGLGDVSVFVFFGLVGVVGSYYLQAGEMCVGVWLPAASMGFMSCGVLNMNNMRDVENDKHAGKKTIPTKIGLKASSVYQFALMSASVIIMAFYAIHYGNIYQLISLFAAIPLVINAIRVLKSYRDTAFLDSQLKVISLSTLGISILFFLGSYAA